MFYTDGKLQFPVHVESPDPSFARALQQAIGGVEGEMNTAAEELGHIEMLATAVALNLEGVPVSIKDEVAADPVASAGLGGLNMKNLLSAGHFAMPVDSDGCRSTCLTYMRAVILQPT